MHVLVPGPATVRYVVRADRDGFAAGPLPPADGLADTTVDLAAVRLVDSRLAAWLAQLACRARGAALDAATAAPAVRAQLRRLGLAHILGRQ